MHRTQVLIQDPLDHGLRVRAPSLLLLQILHQDPARPDPGILAGFTPEEWAELIAEASRYRLAFQLRDYLKAHPDLVERVPAAGLQGLDDTIRETMNPKFLC